MYSINSIPNFDIDRQSRLIRTLKIFCIENKFLYQISWIISYYEIKKDGDSNVAFDRFLDES